MKNSIIPFLKKLEANNNREWFAENKTLYDKAKKECIDLIASIQKPLSAFDPDIKDLNPADCMFRIFRDVRFSKDKSPYKTNFGASINKSGKKIHNAGYYLHLQPGNSFLGGGIYMPDPEMLKKIRSEVFYNYEDFKKIVNEKAFKKYFKTIQGEQLVQVPKGFPKDFEGADFLKFKDFTVLHFVDETELSEEQFIKKALEAFKAMKPLNDFLNTAIQ